MGEERISELNAEHWIARCERGITTTMIEPFEIRVLPLTGRAIHHGDDHAHTTMGRRDYIEAGSDMFGSLSFSLLRAESMTMRLHRWKAVGAVWKRFKDYAEEVARVARVDEEAATKSFQQRPRMIMWDLIGLVGETCEQLAAFYTAMRAWHDDQTDIATTLLAWQGATHRLFQEPGFQDLDWWNQRLGATPNADRMALLTPKGQALVAAALAQTASRLPMALEALKIQYTPDLHRVAMRRKHLAPLLDATLATVFDTADAEAEAWLREQVENGALILADDRVRSGQRSQIVIPVSEHNMFGLFDLWSHANWLCGTLASATAGLAEHSAGVPWSWDFDKSPVAARDADDFVEAVYTYLGSDPEEAREQLRTVQESHERWDRASEGEAEPSAAGAAPRNRAERRRQARETRG